ncbi:hypothetical protein ACFXHA_34030 [Nocardia sp. NPDC059240]|uniref:hypothetical protein n=1 Tax=Nocardia sp. NPDC059240 TaxID=3346786 RepID=UPI0036C51A13
MTDSAPTVVGLYSFMRGAPLQRVAEFRWDPKGGVSLTVFDVEQGYPFQEWFEAGIPSEADDRVVMPSEGERFMRALIWPTRQMGYHRIWNESEPST